MQVGKSAHYNRQIALEEQFVEEGVERLRRTEKALERRQGVAWKSARLAFGNCFQLLERAIALEQQREIKAPKVLRHSVALLSLPAGKQAFICLHALANAMRDMDSSHGTWPRAGGIAREIGKRCEAERKLDLRLRRAVNVIDVLLIRNRNRSNARKRAGDMVARLEQDWAVGAVALHLGAQLIALAIRDCRIEGVPIFERVLLNQGTGKAKKSYIGLSLTEAGITWITAYQRFMKEFAAPVFRPMLVKPRRWTSLSSGGYLTGFDLRLIKARNYERIEGALKKRDLGRVFESVNALQETPWRINGDIYRIVRACWKKTLHEGAPFPRVKSLVPVEMPPPARACDSVETVARRRAQRAAAYHHNAFVIGFKANMRMRLSAAWHLRKEERFFFPYQLDQRGRVYPIPQLIHPQGDDVARALLEFSDGKRLGAEGLVWLTTHIANMYGKDLTKLPFVDRRQWVLDHECDITRSAEQPLAMFNFWSVAKRPWCFLAACFEYRKWKLNGDSFASHLPINMDGTCNGLQHLTALARDADGARATNLIPGNRPEDLYQEVASLASERIVLDSHNGVEEAAIWGRISREHAKPAAMTKPYGITTNGIRRDILDRIKKEEEPFDKYVFADAKAAWKSADYLARVLASSVDAVVSKVTHIEAKMHEVVNLLAKRDRGLRWTVPTGFVVTHEYRRERERRVETPLGTFVVYDTPKNSALDVRKQRNAIVANLVHSLDAAHMMLTVQRLRELGIKHFAMVHDSYGVHAADVPLMNRVLRGTFVELYRQDILKRVIDEQEALNPDLVFPPSLPLGALNVEDVQCSEYFFA